jgi:hypothetical protein
MGTIQVSPQLRLLKTLQYAVTGAHPSDANFTTLAIPHDPDLSFGSKLPAGWMKNACGLPD